MDASGIPRPRGTFRDGPGTGGDSGGTIDGVKRGECIRERREVDERRELFFVAREFRSYEK